MRKLLFPLLAAATLAGCGLGGAPAYGLGPGGPMHARITPGGYGQIHFSVDRPAYVAVFEMIPGSGMRVVYPEFNTDGRFVTAGSYSLLDRRWRSEYAGYFPTHFAGMGPYSSLGSRMASPRYFFLIASRAPLRVSPYVHSPTALRSALGWQTFASRSPYSAMDALADLVLTDQTPGSWTSDVYVDWPEPAMPSLLNSVPVIRVVQCANGTQIFVPAGANTWQCPGDPTPPTAQPAPTDSAEVRKPQRRRPEVPRGEPSATPDRSRPSGPVARPREPVQRPELERPRPERPSPERPRPDRTRPEAHGGRVAEPPREPARAEPRPTPEPVRPVVERPAVERPAAERPAAERPVPSRPDTR